MAIQSNSNIYLPTYHKELRRPKFCSGSICFATAAIPFHLVPSVPGFNHQLLDYVVQPVTRRGTSVAHIPIRTTLIPIGPNSSMDSSPIVGNDTVLRCLYPLTIVIHEHPDG